MSHVTRSKLGSTCTGRRGTTGSSSRTTMCRSIRTAASTSSGMVYSTMCSPRPTCATAGASASPSSAASVRRRTTSGASRQPPHRSRLWRRQ
nr:MAG TPA: hypothetical protein [Caudoviricetes sp.]